MDPEPQGDAPILVGSFKLVRNSKGKTWEIKVNENFSQEKNDAMFAEIVRMNDQFEHQFGTEL
jgi:hypothetical protein